MRVIAMAIPDVLIINPQIFSDSRGCFFESFNQRVFDNALGREITFVQDNHSESANNVLRGLHYQLSPKEQGKLVRVVRGKIFDVAVDIRKESATFGRWVGEVLSAENKKQMWIPPGFAHGFLIKSEKAEVLYKTTDYYSPEHERCILWNDPGLAIDWPLNEEPVLSVKDIAGSRFNDL